MIEADSKANWNLPFFVPFLYLYFIIMFFSYPELMIFSYPIS